MRPVPTGSRSRESLAVSPSRIETASGVCAPGPGIVLHTPVPRGRWFDGMTRGLWPSLLAPGSGGDPTPEGAENRDHRPEIPEPTVTGGTSNDNSRDRGSRQADAVRTITPSAAGRVSRGR